MKALVTGAKGMLGSDLCLALQTGGYEVLATDVQEMDVQNPHQVRLVVSKVCPDIVFHLAAWTNVDACEQHPDEAYRTNAIGTQNVALMCQELDIPVVYIGTISVFDGTKCEPYTEFDTPNPQSWYSRSKWEGEKIVQHLLRRYFIVRAGWMFGGGTKDKKFVAKIMDLAQQRTELQVVDDKFGSPTYTYDLARSILKLVDTGWYGVYHSVNTGKPCSRFEFAQKIIEFAGIATSCRLMPVSSSVFPLPAPRPRMEAAINLRSQLLGLNLMRPWEGALAEYVSKLKGDQ